MAMLTPLTPAIFGGVLLLDVVIALMILRALPPQITIVGWVLLVLAWLVLSVGGIFLAPYLMAWAWEWAH